eukprot:1491308-Rhodomonas_salina.1
MRKETDRQLWLTALSHNAKLRLMAEEWEDPEWLATKAAHSRNHDNRMLWECAHLPRKLRFRLIPTAANPMVYHLHFLPSLMTHCFEIAQQERETAFRQYLHKCYAERIYSSHVSKPYVQ